MSYEYSRDQAQIARLDKATDDFIGRAGKHKPATRRTMFVFPGGMASRLFRATAPYNKAGQAVQISNFTMAWLDISSLVPPGATNLMMQRHGIDGYRDFENHIIVADGGVSFASFFEPWLGPLLDDFLDPYGYFTQWCFDQGVDCFVFGWDWRRKTFDTADFFARQFLPRFRQQVIDAGLPDPLTNYTLLGHSFGSMVVNHLNRWPPATLPPSPPLAPLPGNMTKAIAVGGLFHGYGGQLHRWFQPDSTFKALDQTRMLQTIASLPGPYELMVLPDPTWQELMLVQRGPGQSPPYPLPDYPSADAIVIPQLDDPYDPPAAHYPTTTGFDAGYLAAARETVRHLARSAGSKADKRFVSIQGIKTDLFGEDLNSTSSNTGWKPPGNTALPDPDLVTDTASVPGDGTLPAWSTYFQGGEVHTVRDFWLEHMLLLYDPKILAAVYAAIP